MMRGIIEYLYMACNGTLSTDGSAIFSRIICFILMSEKIVLITSHILSDIQEVADEVYEFDNKQIIPFSHIQRPAGFQ